MNKFLRCQCKKMLEWINIQKTKAKPEQQVGAILAHPLRSPVKVVTITFISDALPLKSDLKTLYYVLSPRIQLREN